MPLPAWDGLESPRVVGLIIKPEIFLTLPLAVRGPLI